MAASAGPSFATCADSALINTIAFNIPHSSKHVSELSLQALHTANPAVVVRCLATKVFENGGMRQDKKRLGREAAHHCVGDHGRFEHAVDSRDAPVLYARSHRGVHSLRREDRHLDTGFAMCDREPL